MVNRSATTGGVMMALATLGTVGCERATISASFAVSATIITGMSGSGEIGSGQPTFDGVDRQVFSLNAGTTLGVAYGELDYIDYGFLKEDGNYPHFVVGPGWPGTSVLTFLQTSPACAEFEGVGFLINTGEYLAYRVETCDYGSPGVGVDFFGISVPQRFLTHGAPYQAGPLQLSAGELTLQEASGIP